MKTFAVATSFILGYQSAVSQKAPESNIRGCIDPSSFDPSIDYFPEKAIVEFSQNWNVTYRSYYKVITVTDTPSWEGAVSSTYTYVLYQCGADIPEDSNIPDDAQYISVPVSDFALTQSSEIPHIELLGLRVNTTAYAGDDQYIESPCVLSLIDDGSIELFTNSSEFLSAYPGGLSLAGSWDIDKSLNGRVAILEDSEDSNMAIFEWHKLYGILFNAEADANDVFDVTKERYDCASSEAIFYSSKMPQESILWAYYSEYGGGWDVADCPNYYCEYAEHCGAKFLNSSEGSLRDDWGGVYMNDTEFEAHAKDADVWIYAGFDFDTYYSQKKEILDGFESIRNKRVFDYSSNAWFEQRFAEPDAVLQDFCDVLGVGNKEHERKWFRNVFSEGKYYSEQCSDVNAPLETKATECSTSKTKSPSEAPNSSSMFASPSYLAVFATLLCSFVL